MALPVIWEQTTKCLNFSFEREMFSRRATSQANQADDTRRSIKVWVLRGGDDFPGKPAFNNGCNGMSCASTKYLLPKGNSNFPSECKVCESIIIRSGCNICKIELRGGSSSRSDLSPFSSLIGKLFKQRLLSSPCIVKCDKCRPCQIHLASLVVPNYRGEGKVTDFVV